MFDPKIKNICVILIVIMVLTSTSSVALLQIAIADSPIVTESWVLRNLHNNHVVFLDARSLDEYIGKDVRALRGGHIPGAINIDFNYLYDCNATLRTTNELMRMFGIAGVTSDKLVVCYCQSGSRAQIEYNALQMLGYPELKIYLGGWQEWGNDPNAPVDTTCTMALVNGPKANSVYSSCGCSSGGIPGVFSKEYVYQSILTGAKRMIELARAFMNSNFTRLSTNFVSLGYIPVVSNFTAAKVISDNGLSTEESIVRILPYKPIMHSDIFVGAAILSSTNPSTTGGFLLENIEGKSWTTLYWINETGALSTLKIDPCDWLGLILCALGEEPEVFANCIVACYLAIYFGWEFPELWVICIGCIILYLANSIYCRSIYCWTPSMTIHIVSTTVNDPYYRYHGVSMNSPLDSVFWYNEPQKIVATTYDSLDWSNTYSGLPSGSNYVVYAPSCQGSYYWHAKIYVNDVLTAEGDCNAGNPLTAYFDVPIQ